MTTSLVLRNSKDGILVDTPYRVKVLKSGKAKWEVAK